MTLSALLTACALLAVERGDIKTYVAPQWMIDLTEAREYSYTGGRYNQEPFKYRLFVPRNVKIGEQYPLLVWLHGYGEFDAEGRKSVRWLPLIFEDRGHVEKYRFYILVVQCPPDNSSWFSSPASENDDTEHENEMLTVTQKIIEQTMQERPIAPNRVYLSGVSSGGSGCWELAMRHPEQFAAVVPIASDGGDESRAYKLAHIPIWAFHNRFDSGTKPTGVMRIARAVNDVGGNASLTLLPKAGHDCWTAAFQDYHIMQWMLQQNRGDWWRCRLPGSRPGSWWHIIAVPAVFFSIVWFGCCLERRRWRRTTISIAKERDSQMAAHTRALM